MSPERRLDEINLMPILLLVPLDSLRAALVLCLDGCSKKMNVYIARKVPLELVFAHLAE